MFCQLSVWPVWYCTLFMLVITLQRLVFHVRTPLAIQHFHSLSTVDTPYSLFGLCTGCEQSFCVLLLCYFDIFLERNFAWGFFFSSKPLNLVIWNKGGKTSLLFEIISASYQLLLVIVRGVYKVIEITNKSFYYYFF